MNFNVVITSFFYFFKVVPVKPLLQRQTVHITNMLFMGLVGTEHFCAFSAHNPRNGWHSNISGNRNIGRPTRGADDPHSNAKTSRADGNTRLLQ